MLQKHTDTINERTTRHPKLVPHECRMRVENIQEVNADKILNIDANYEAPSLTLLDDVSEGVMCDKKRKTFSSLFTLSRSPSAAFTLAEILITLGIIGVIAAMTIPNLIGSFEKQATVTGYKKAYSTLTQAVKRSEVDNGEVKLWDFPTTRKDAAQSTQFFNTYLAPYLSIAKSCGTADGCWTTTLIPNKTTQYSGPTSASCIKYVLNDGTAISIYNYGYASAFPTTTLRGLEIYVDINGSKKPNITGKDVFAFLLVEGAGGYNASDGNLGNMKIGGIYPDGYGIGISDSSYNYRGCDKDVTYPAAGSYCGMKIIKDGWEIKDDYPWN